MSEDNPYAAPRDGLQAAPNQRTLRLRFVLVPLLLAVAVILAAGGFREMRNAAKRESTRSNMKQLGDALRNYQDGTK